MSRPLEIARVLARAARSLLLATLFAVAAVLVLDRPDSMTVGLLLLNVLPLVLVFGMCRAVLNSSIVSAAATLLLYVALLLINRMKLRALGLPLLAADFQLLGMVVSHPRLFIHYVSVGELVFGITSLGVLVAAMVTSASVRRRVPSALSVRRRTGLFCVSASVLAATLGPLPLHRLYGAPDLEWFYWDPRENTEAYGLLFSIIRDSPLLFRARPTADTKIVEDFIAANGLRPLGEVERAAPFPDLIVVLNESMFEPGILAGVEPCEFTAGWCAIAARGVSGDLEVPTYGGNTSRTEFELLTGISLQSFPGDAFPYVSLVTGPMIALPRYLKQFGYETVAIHPHSRAFWRRSTVFPYMGFDRFISERDFGDAERVGPYIADAEIVPVVRSILTDDRPQFVFVITMENHGPWGDRPNLTPERWQTIDAPAGLGPDARREWQQYILHLRSGEAMNRELAAVVEGRAYPTYLLGFGDHLPGLERVFASLGFDDARAAGAQRAPYFLISNQPLEPDRIDTSVHLLPAILLDRAAIPKDEFFQALTLLVDGSASAADRLAIAAFQVERLSMLPSPP